MHTNKREVHTKGSSSKQFVVNTATSPATCTQVVTRLSYDCIAMRSLRESFYYVVRKGYQYGIF
jgi:hypothetical protein